MALLCVKARGSYGYNTASFLSDVTIVSRPEYFDATPLRLSDQFPWLK